MEDDIAKILGGLGTNRHGPSPSGARVGNSPLAGAMRRRGHARNVSLPSSSVKASPPRVASRFGATCAPCVLRDAPAGAPWDEVSFDDGIKKKPHPEEAAKRPSRRMHEDHPTEIRPPALSPPPRPL